MLWKGIPKRILIVGAGGSPATNFVRSLRLAVEPFYLVGTDCDKYHLCRAETDKKYLVPPAYQKNYLSILNKIIKKEKIDFIHAQNDTEIRIISELREKLEAKCFFPKKKTIRICQNKFESYKKWKKAGLYQPQTIFLNNENDLKRAIKQFKKIWIREQSGAGAKGALPTNKYEQAKSWIDFHSGWGKFIAAEYLSSNSVTWQSIWNKGKLVVAQTRKRLYWELGKISPNGVSGATGGAITISNPKIDKISQQAILAIDKKPHGIFSVDMTYDKKGIPVPTEINIGRFFTTHEFFTQAKLNMPYIFIKIAFEEKYSKIKKKINPLPNNLIWIRGMDFLPILTTKSKLHKYEK